MRRALKPSLASAFTVVACVALRVLLATSDVVLCSVVVTLTFAATPAMPAPAAVVTDVSVLR